MALETFDREQDRARYPGRSDQRTIKNALWPEFRPSFGIAPGSRIFTIGSCFARNIELFLVDFEVPTLRFEAPKSEWPHLPNGLLNEFNPGTIAQRIERAFAGTVAPTSTIVERAEGGVVDLLLPGAAAVGEARAHERRAEIDAVYLDLPRSDVVIITLGLVEAWQDSQEEYYLNRMPPTEAMEREPDRYRVVVLDVAMTMQLLEPAFQLLSNNGKKVVLTVSPVPLIVTFTGEDVVIANFFSKSVLRVCAQLIASNFSNVDYFPSYEIVTSGGLSVLYEDNIHVQNPFVGEIVKFMLLRYGLGISDKLERRIQEDPMAAT